MGSRLGKGLMGALLLLLLGLLTFFNAPGVVGIGYWEGAVCDATVPGIVKAIRYAVDRIGVAHGALGSDFDGATRMPFDVTGLPQLTQGLAQAGFSVDDIRVIMGGNVQRLLLENLPRV